MAAKAGQISQPHANGSGSSKSFYSKQYPKPQNNMASPTINYYDLLGTTSNATHPEILKAAKKARIAAHPDRRSGEGLSPEEVDRIVEQSKAVGEAADVLSEPSKRLRYDAKLRKEQRTPTMNKNTFTKPTEHEATQRPRTTPTFPPPTWQGTPPRIWDWFKRPEQNPKDGPKPQGRENSKETPNPFPKGSFDFSQCTDRSQNPWFTPQVQQPEQPKPSSKHYFGFDWDQLPRPRTGPPEARTMPQPYGAQHNQPTNSVPVSPFANTTTPGTEAPSAGPSTTTWPFQSNATAGNSSRCVRGDEDIDMKEADWGGGADMENQEVTERIGVKEDPRTL